MLPTSIFSRIRRKYYYIIDSTLPFAKLRWLFTLILIIIYFYRCFGMSYDVITYLIGFYIFQIMINYFTPKGLIEVEEEAEPLCESFEYGEDKPLVSEMSEFQVWERVSSAFMLGICCTLFKAFQIDVFFPLLMIYFVILICYTIHKIVTKMKKYGYSSIDFKKNLKSSFWIWNIVHKMLIYLCTFLIKKLLYICKFRLFELKIILCIHSSSYLYYFPPDN